MNKKTFEMVREFVNETSSKTQLVTGERKSRKVLILDNIPHCVASRVYHEIVGVDAETMKIVNIIDTNGRKMGWYSGNDGFSSIKKDSVIVAEFVVEENEKVENTLRIAGAYTYQYELKAYDLFGTLIWQKGKYRLYDPFAKQYTMESDELEKIVTSNEKNISFYTLVHIISEIRKNPRNNTCQVRFGKYFINLPKEYNDVEGFGYFGHMLVKVEIHKGKSPMLCALELYKKVEDKSVEEYLAIGKERARLIQEDWEETMREIEEEREREYREFIREIEEEEERRQYEESMREMEEELQQLLREELDAITDATQMYGVAEFVNMCFALEKNEYIRLQLEEGSPMVQDTEEERKKGRILLNQIWSKAVENGNAEDVVGKVQGYKEMAALTGDSMHVAIKVEKKGE